jgi:hypothetical protein
MSLKVWLVMKVYPTGKKFLHEAYFDEERARYSASRLVGSGDGEAVMLWAVDVMDDPREAGTQQYIEPV